MPKLPRKLRELFKKKKKEGDYEQMLDPAEIEAVIRDPTRLAFRAQLAHGSSTVNVSNFSNIHQLYERLSILLNVDESKILFCTINNYTTDMDCLIGGTINMDDFIYVHIFGKKKEITINKSEPSIGITITDNGAGKALIKRIRPDSVAGRVKDIFPGDHIQSINGETMVGLRHYEVAKVLKSLPQGVKFKMVLVEPKKEFDQIAPRQPLGKTTTSGASDLARSLSGAEKNMAEKIKAYLLKLLNILSRHLPASPNWRVSLRLRRDGKTAVQDMPTDFEMKARESIDDLLEAHLGIRDSEMATTIVETYKEKNNHLQEFSDALKATLLVDMMNENLLFALWTKLGDIRRINPASSEKSD